MKKETKINYSHTKIQAWVKALRLRTLPLSISGVVLGSFIAYETGHFSPIIAFSCFVTIVLLQILSNLANDLGDTLKGTDNSKRTGPMRSVQSGIISIKEMKIGIGICVLLCLFSGISLLFLSFKSFNYSFLGLFILGLLGITAALKYTLGKGAYGYHGLGDIFVLFFFGFIPVFIAYFIQVQTWNNLLLLAGFSIGNLSASVLNLNNLRDYENDKACNKRTLVVRMGLFYGKTYHTCLVVCGLISAILYTMASNGCIYNYIYLITFIPFLQNIYTVWNTKDTALLDKELKRNSISTFLLSIHWGIGLLLC